MHSGPPKEPPRFDDDLVEGGGDKMTTTMSVSERYEITLSGDDLDEILVTAGRLVEERHRLGDRVSRASFGAGHSDYRDLTIVFVRNINGKGGKG